MKATKHITTTIAVLFLGFITLSAQTNTRENKERATVKRTEARQTHTKQANARQTTQSRQKTVKPQRTQTTQSRQNTVKPQRQQTSQARQTTVRPQRQQTAHVNKTRQPTNHARPVSISTPRNPKSDYRAPKHKTHVKNNKYSEKRYYGGNHYHHNTYIHHYNVLYYPAYNEMYWTRNMYNDYRRWYPNYRWRYDYGYRIQTMSIFDAKYNLGEVAMVYGRVYATWHNQETDDYLLFFGGDYPAQQFTVVLPGHLARRFSWRPERYFLGEHMTATGLITTFDGIPEIIVKNKRQVGIY